MYRVAAHLAVIGLVALSAGFGFSKLQQTSTPNGLALDLVDTARDRLYPTIMGFDVGLHGLDPEVQQAIAR